MYGTNIPSLERNVKSLQRQVRESASDAAEELAQQVEEVRSMVTAPIQRVHELGSDLDPRPFIRRHPLASLGVAFASTFLLAASKRRAAEQSYQLSKSHAAQVSETVREAVVGCIIALATNVVRDGFQMLHNQGSKGKFGSRMTKPSVDAASADVARAASLFDGRSTL